MDTDKHPMPWEDETKKEPPFNKSYTGNKEVLPAKYFEMHGEDSKDRTKMGTMYGCSICGSSYVWKKTLNKHWKDKHDSDGGNEEDIPPGMKLVLDKGVYVKTGPRRCVEKSFLDRMTVTEEREEKSPNTRFSPFLATYVGMLQALNNNIVMKQKDTNKDCNDASHSLEHDDAQQQQMLASDSSKSNSPGPQILHSQASGEGITRCLDGEPSSSTMSGIKNSSFLKIHPRIIEGSKRLTVEELAKTSDNSLTYKCTEQSCQFKSHDADVVTQHMKTHEPFKRFGCSGCPYRTRWAWDSRRHLQRCDSKDKDLLVIDHDSKRTIPEVKDTPTGQHSAPESKRQLSISSYSCKTCIDLQQCVAHQKEHLDTEPKEEQQRHLFPPVLSSGLVNDDRLKHPRKEYKLYPCAQCNFVGLNRSNLEIHQSEMHRGEKCKWCDMRWRTREQYRDHVIYLHLEEYNPNEWEPLFRQDALQNSTTVNKNNTRWEANLLNDRAPENRRKEVSKVHNTVTDNPNKQRQSPSSSPSSCSPVSTNPSHSSSQKTKADYKVRCQWCHSDFRNITCLMTHCQTNHATELWKLRLLEEHLRKLEQTKSDSNKTHQGVAKNSDGREVSGEEKGRSGGGVKRKLSDGRCWGTRREI